MELHKLKGGWLSSNHMEVARKAVSLVFNKPELFKVVTDSEYVNKLTTGFENT
jgi:hypothetical protein